MLSIVILNTGPSSGLYTVSAGTSSGSPAGFFTDKFLGSALLLHPSFTFKITYNAELLLFSSAW